MRTSASWVRRKVFERDRGVCALCLVNTVKHLEARRQRARGTGALWHADHVVPVAEGGGECGLEGYRTLCIGCHKAETAALRRRLSRAKGAKGRGKV